MGGIPGVVGRVAPVPAPGDGRIALSAVPGGRCDVPGDGLIAVSATPGGLCDVPGDGRVMVLPSYVPGRLFVPEEGQVTLSRPR